MRQTQVFSGSSHPTLVNSICDCLGQKPAQAELKEFSNGETSVQIQTSIRDQNVFIVQSGSSRVNDNIIELLIMISACKGGSARSITAVMPYFPYSRQSKKKSHRGAITARMIANLLHVAGVNHVITVDLHASQMQGFFKCPVDNLVAEHLLARWIRVRVPNWRDGVVVSKNAGGTKRVTSLADALKLSFGIVTTDRRRMFPSAGASVNGSINFEIMEEVPYDEGNPPVYQMDGQLESKRTNGAEERHAETGVTARERGRVTSNALARANGVGDIPSSPLARSTWPANSSIESTPLPPRLLHTYTAPPASHMQDGQSDGEYTDERARDVIQGRFVHGHIVDENFPSPCMSAGSVQTSNVRTRPGSDGEHSPERMMASFMSTASSVRQDHALGGAVDAGASSEEEEEGLKNPELETTVTLVGNVRDRPVFIVDDMIDKSASWIAAAETVVKRGGATKVYCMATHGLFGGDCLAEMEECDCIDRIVVTNTFPIPPEQAARSQKLAVLDVSPLLAEAMRRNHHGESMSLLYPYLQEKS